jgi:hypothetical protein
VATTGLALTLLSPDIDIAKKKLTHFGEKRSNPSYFFKCKNDTFDCVLHCIKKSIKKSNRNLLYLLSQLVKNWKNSLKFTVRNFLVKKNLSYLVLFYKTATKQS